MQVIIERDFVMQNVKVWFLEHNVYGTRAVVPTGGDSWQSHELEPGAHPDPELKPLTLTQDMALALRDALNETDMPLRGSDANTVLIDVLRNENERNSQRVDKLLDAVITSKKTIVVPGGATLQRTGEEDHG